MNYYKRLVKNHLPGLTRSLVLVAIFAVAGFFALRSSGASSYASSAEAESGTVAGNASVEVDATISGGKAVQFGAPPATATPPPVGSYIQPGDVGYKGPLSGLIVADSTHVPPGCNWDKDEGFICSGTLTFDGYYFKAGIYWDSDGTLTLKHSVVEGGTPNGVGKWTIRAFNHTNCLIDISDSTLSWPSKSYDGSVAFDGSNGNPRSSTGAASVLTDCREKMYRNEVKQGDSGFLPVRDGDEFVQNYIHDVRRIIGVSHNDGIFPEAGKNILIQQNYIDDGYDGSSQTAVLFWQGSGMDGHRVWANYLSGGGYTFYNQSATNLDVQNNTFDDTSYNGSSANRQPLFGLTAMDGGSIKTWSGNVTTSGKTVPKP